MTRERIYLAGPDVFLPDAIEIGNNKKALCQHYGFVGLFPFDNEVGSSLSGEPLDHLIYRENIAMIRQADLAIINLTPFRGPSADVGSVFELGFAHGLGKPVFGYTNVTSDLVERVAEHCPGLRMDADGLWRDEDGMSVENFGNADNLMIDACLSGAGRPLIRVPVARSERYRDLRGFEECLRLADRELRGPLRRAS